MDTETRIKVLVADCVRAREACKTADDVWIGQLEGMREAALNISADLEQAQRLAAAERARHKSEMDRGRAEENELALRIKEARKELERAVKETTRHKAEIRKIMDDIMGKAVA